MPTFNIEALRAQEIQRARWTWSDIYRNRNGTTSGPLTLREGDIEEGDTVSILFGHLTKTDLPNAKIAMRIVVTEVVDTGVVVGELTKECLPGRPDTDVH